MEHPRLAKVSEPGPNGPKVAIKDWLAIEPSPHDHRKWVYRLGTGHHPASPRGGNVTAGDGSGQWVPVDDWVQGPTWVDGNGDKFGLTQPLGYYTQLSGQKPEIAPYNEVSHKLHVRYPDGREKENSPTVQKHRAWYGYPAYPGS